MGNVHEGSGNGHGGAGNVNGGAGNVHEGVGNVHEGVWNVVQKIRSGGLRAKMGFKKWKRCIFSNFLFCITGQIWRWGLKCATYCFIFCIHKSFLDHIWYLFHSQNKQFVYRGKPLEKIGEFCFRIQNQYPDAEVCRNGIPSII